MFSWCSGLCRKRTPEQQRRLNDEEEARIKRSVAAFQWVTIEDIGMRGEYQSWENTIAKSGLSHASGVCSAAVRLVGFHLFQPAVYLSAVYTFWPELDAVQRMLGRLVAVREGLYILGLASLVVMQPSALLVDVGASWRSTTGRTTIGERDSIAEGRLGVFLYVLAPEKIVFLALGKATGGALGLLTAVLDLCAILALVEAFRSGVAPAALVAGYGMSALSAVMMLYGIGSGFGSSVYGVAILVFGLGVSIGLGLAVHYLPLIPDWWLFPGGFVASLVLKLVGSLAIQCGLIRDIESDTFQGIHYISAEDLVSGVGNTLFYSSLVLFLMDLGIPEAA